VINCSKRSATRFPHRVALRFSCVRVRYRESLVRCVALPRSRRRKRAETLPKRSDAATPRRTPGTPRHPHRIDSVRSHQHPARSQSCAESRRIDSHASARTQRDRVRVPAQVKAQADSVCTKVCAGNTQSNDVITQREAGLSLLQPLVLTLGVSLNTALRAIDKTT
jgi:hypothetical protein